MYVTVEEFREATGLPATKFSDAQVERALLFAEQLFDELTLRNAYGMWCEPKERTIALDGRGHRILRLPWKIVRVLQVLADGEDITEECASYGWFLSRRDNPFPEGDKNISINGLFGDTEAMVQEGDTLRPHHTVRQAVIALAELRLTREKVFRDERVIRIGPLNEIRVGSITGHVAVDGIIEAYKVRPVAHLEVHG